MSTRIPESAPLQAITTPALQGGMTAQTLTDLQNLATSGNIPLVGDKQLKGSEEQIRALGRDGPKTKNVELSDQVIREWAAYLLA